MCQKAVSQVGGVSWFDGIMHLDWVPATWVWVKVNLPLDRLSGDYIIAKIVYMCYVSGLETYFEVIKQIPIAFGPTCVPSVGPN